MEADEVVMAALGPVCGPELLRVKRDELARYERQVGEWEREVFFDQEHEPGAVIQMDWTHMDMLGITIAGHAYRHLLCHAVLPYSNWEWATRCQSESLLSARLGLQAALVRLGRVPKVLQIDNSSAATHQLRRDGSGRGFNPEFLALAEHFGLEPWTINIA